MILTGDYSFLDPTIEANLEQLINLDRLLFVEAKPYTPDNGVGLEGFWDVELVFDNGMSKEIVLNSEALEWLRLLIHKKGEP